MAHRCHFKCDYICVPVCNCLYQTSSPDNLLVIETYSDNAELLNFVSLMNSSTMKSYKENYA